MKIEEFEGFKTGIYDHYKGGKYLVLGIAGLSDNGYLQRLSRGEEGLMVVYVSLTGIHMPGPRLRVRSLAEFTSPVTWPSTGEVKPRFSYVGFQLESPIDDTKNDTWKEPETPECPECKVAMIVTGKEFGPGSWRCPKCMKTWADFS